MKFDRLSPLCLALALAACSGSQGTSAEPPRPPPAAAGLSPAPQRSEAAGTPQPAAASADDALAARFASARPLETLNGNASYYSDRLAGHRTASGAPYRPEALTAAHRKLPLGTVLRVTRSDDGRVVYVRVNDRGPFTKHRILDLSRAAAERLGMLQSGVVAVRAEVVAYGASRRRR